MLRRVRSGWSTRDGSRRRKPVSGAAQRARRGDQREVREALREVADQPLACRVVLLGEEPEGRAQREQALEELFRFVEPAGEGVVVGEPEAARQKRTFGAREA